MRWLTRLWQKNTSEPTSDAFTLEMIERAQRCSTHFNSTYKSKLNFSLGSIQTVDLLLEDARERYDTLDAIQKNWLIVSTSSYTYEVCRRAFGGTYYWWEAKDQAILVCGEPTFSIGIAWKEKIKKRLTNGPEDDLVFFANGFKQRIEKAKPGDQVTFT